LSDIPASEEQIVDGDDPVEVDVEGEQAPADWGKQESSDEGLAPETRKRLGLQ